MAKNILIILIFIILLISVLYLIFYRPTPTATTQIKIKDTEYSLEIAETIAQQVKGLGDRQSLCSNCGMVFVFPKDGIQPFWMKDTLISLDMIWVNSENTIVSIQTASTENDPSNPKKIYKNTDPARYVIELNAGDANKLNLKIGDKIPINL